MPEPYHYVRFRWWNTVNLDEAAKRLRSERFTVERHAMPKEETEPSLRSDEEKDHVIAKADTLKALLTATNVTLSQDEAEPFTGKDLRLREVILEIYPRDRPTPFPWHFQAEPKFEVAA